MKKRAVKVCKKSMERNYNQLSLSEVLKKLPSSSLSPSRTEIAEMAANVASRGNKLRNAK